MQNNAKTIEDIAYAASIQEKASTPLLTKSDQYLSGITLSYSDFFPFKIKEGRMFTTNEEDQGDAVCIIGYQTAINYFGNTEAIGQTIKVGSHKLTVSGGTQWPIRWIVDDARKFVARQVRRGKRYQLIVLDPPSYGHGASGQRWSLSQHLQSLLSDCLELLEPQRGILLLTAHCETPTAGDIAQWLKSQVPTAHVEHDRLQLAAQSGKLLDAGFYVRFALNRNTQLLRLA